MGRIFNSKGGNKKCVHSFDVEAPRRISKGIFLKQILRK
jgi:hypothetical protein